MEWVELLLPAAIIIVGLGITIQLPKIIQLNRLTSSKSQRALQKLDQEYIEELEYKLKQYKNTANQMQRGPSVEGDLSELSDLLPNVVGQFADYAPKWLKPILKQPDAQKWILEYAEKNPEKVGEIFGRFIKKKSAKQEGEQTPDMSGL